MNVKWADGQPLPLFITSAYNAAHRERDTLDQRLADFAVPITAHWILAGDFNRHDSFWSRRMAAGASNAHHARPLRQFIVDRGLSLLNDPEVATRRSFEGGVSTVLDLVLVSPALAEMGMADYLEVSFEQATFSDHIPS